MSLAAYYASAVVWGVRSIYPHEQSALDLLVPTLLAVALGWWAIADARVRGRPMPLLAQPWFVLIAFLLVPGYVIWTRRWKGVMWLVLHSVCWYALCTAALHTAGTIVYGQQWWQAIGLVSDR